MFLYETQDEASGDGIPCSMDMPQLRELYTESKSYNHNLEVTDSVEEQKQQESVKKKFKRAVGKIKALNKIKEVIVPEIPEIDDGGSLELTIDSQWNCTNWLEIPKEVSLLRPWNHMVCTEWANQKQPTIWEECSAMIESVSNPSDINK